MKIRLNDDEVYEIKLPDEIEIVEFNGLVEKFNFLLKNFQRFNMGMNTNPNEIVLTREVTTQRKFHDKAKWRFLKENREKFVELFDIYYNKSNKEFKEFLIANNIDFSRGDMSSGTMIRLKEFHSLKPIEVKLIKFPNKREQINHLRIRDNTQNE